MPNPHISTQDWYYHAPIKRTTKSPKAAPPASQIPGIGGLKDEFANPESDERHFRRKWIRDTDSKYIKMAKQGGRKNLLAYRSPPVKPDEPVPYPRVDWFDHDHPEEDDEAGQPAQLEEQHKEPAKEGYRVLPDWYVHVHDLPSDDEVVTGAYTRKRPIIGFDNLSNWQREDKDSKGNTSNVRLPPLKRIHKRDKRYEELKQAQKCAPQQRQVRLPKIDPEPVNFKHLLSMGYQRDWLNEQDQKSKEKRTERKQQQKEHEEKREEQNRNAISMRKPKDGSKSDKPLFKLSRFESMQPRVETFRT